MINRKKQQKKGIKYSFWQHYHKVVELSMDGNQELLERLNSYDVSVDKERYYTLANIPEKYFYFDFAPIEKVAKQTFANEEPISIVKKYLESLDNAAAKGIGLYIHGTHGVAKTTISAIILKKAIELYYRCFFWKSTEIAEFVKTGWKNENRRVFFDYIVNTVDFLVIDDVSRLMQKKRTSTDEEELDDHTVFKPEERMLIDRIFTKRDDMNRVTILTSNTEYKDITKLFDDALSSNFKERLIDIHLQGEDFRNSIGAKLIEQL